MRTSASCLPASSRPLRTAAATMIAVPCWSSWKTGMFIRARHCSSTSKHSGALMSSRLMPPKVGSRAQTTSTSLADVVLGHLDVEHVDAGELLEQDGLALHHRLRGQRPDVAEAEHGRAVGEHRDEVLADGEGGGLLRILVDRHAGGGDAGRVGERQVALVAERLGRLDLQFPGPRQSVIDERSRLEIVGHIVAHGRPPRGLRAAPASERVSHHRRDLRWGLLLHRLPDGRNPRAETPESTVPARPSGRFSLRHKLLRRGIPVASGPRPDADDRRILFHRGGDCVPGRPRGARDGRPGVAASRRIPYPLALAASARRETIQGPRRCPTRPPTASL